MSADDADRYVGTHDWSATASASKIAAMLGLSKWDSPKSMALKMMHPERFDEDRSNEAQDTGTYLESGCINLWYAKNPRYQRVAEGEVTYTRDLGFPATATPDGEALDTESETGEHIGIENKVVYPQTAHLWGDPGTDVIPVYYLVQTIWQQHVSGIRRTAVIKNGPYINDQDTYWINYDETLALSIEAEVRLFMAMVAAGIEPENDGRVETVKAIKRVHADIDKDKDWPISLDSAIELEEARAGSKAADARLNLAEANVLTSIGKARRAVVGEGKNALMVARRQKSGKGVALYGPRTPVLDQLYALREQQQADAAAADAA